MRASRRAVAIGDVAGMENPLAAITRQTAVRIIETALTNLKLLALNAALFPRKMELTTFKFVDAGSIRETAY
jgi:hypothetical protein